MCALLHDRAGLNVGPAKSLVNHSGLTDTIRCSNKTVHFHLVVKQLTFMFTGGSALFMTIESLLPLSASLSRAGEGVTVNRDRSCCHFLSTAEPHKAKNSSTEENKAL